MSMTLPTRLAFTLAVLAAATPAAAANKPCASGYLTQVVFQNVKASDMYPSLALTVDQTGFSDKGGSVSMLIGYDVNDTNHHLEHWNMTLAVVQQAFAQRVPLKLTTNAGACDKMRASNLDIQFCSNETACK